MNQQIYKAIARVLGTILVLVGIGAIGGGLFLHSSVSSQLSEQQITMPSKENLTTQEQKDHLLQYAGQPMEDGNQAFAFSDYYIKEHLKQMAGGKNYNEVSGEYMKLSADPKADPQKVAKLRELRADMFQGNSLRGMLLNAYAFWTMGTVAFWAGIGSLIVGAGALIYSFLGNSTKRGSSKATA
ncbi:hypothetical protein QP400_08995 [Winkia sp. UMB3158]|uniref:Aromatic ring-opening dioxygenase LigA n=2 Tax=Winkia neuii TaxID=33007 RepID=K0YVD0_9ACTO|nr:MULTISPECIES: hypothetical protein [Winkia]MDK8341677.1 hypothetical protein [Winkia sp. UMB3164B]OFT39346.1 hypothetical protein HMPREF3163_03505 [Actinomyces sp. HMSC08A01]PMC93210.1 hypothetical protein CJ188_05380 [Actinomyces sp. UMB0918]EJZ87872.1 hypothetical protein HMPREF9240_00131 [Winkia neuii BV029A5]MCG7302027.1 hypothetical protein [Winkia sp. ACRQY]